MFNRGNTGSWESTWSGFNIFKNTYQMVGRVFATTWNCTKQFFVKFDPKDANMNDIDYHVWRGMDIFFVPFNKFNEKSKLIVNEINYLLKGKNEIFPSDYKQTTINTNLQKLLSAVDVIYDKDGLNFIPIEFKIGNKKYPFDINHFNDGDRKNDILDNYYKFNENIQKYCLKLTESRAEAVALKLKSKFHEKDFWDKVKSPQDPYEINKFYSNYSVLKYLKWSLLSVKLMCEENLNYLKWKNLDNSELSGGKWWLRALETNTTGFLRRCGYTVQTSIRVYDYYLENVIKAHILKIENQMESYKNALNYIRELQREYSYVNHIFFPKDDNIKDDVGNTTLKYIEWIDNTRKQFTVNVNHRGIKDWNSFQRNANDAIKKQARGSKLIFSHIAPKNPNSSNIDFNTRLVYEYFEKENKKNPNKSSILLTSINRFKICGNESPILVSIGFDYDDKDISSRWHKLESTTSNVKDIGNNYIISSPVREIEELKKEKYNNLKDNTKNNLISSILDAIGKEIKV